MFQKIRLICGLNIIIGCAFISYKKDHDIVLNNMDKNRAILNTASSSDGWRGERVMPSPFGEVYRLAVKNPIKNFRPPTPWEQVYLFSLTKSTPVAKHISKCHQQQAAAMTSEVRE